MEKVQLMKKLDALNLQCFSLLVTACLHALYFCLNRTECRSHLFFMLGVTCILLKLLLTFSLLYKLLIGLNLFVWNDSRFYIYSSSECMCSPGAAVLNIYILKTVK